MESNEAEITALGRQIELCSGMKKEKASLQHTLESEQASFHKRKSDLSVPSANDVARPN